MLGLLKTDDEIVMNSEEDGRKNKLCHVGKLSKSKNPKHPRGWKDGDTMETFESELLQEDEEEPEENDEEEPEDNYEDEF